MAATAVPTPLPSLPSRSRLRRWRPVRALEHAYFRYQPAALCVISISLVLLVAGLDLAGVDAINKVCGNDAACGIGTNVLVAFAAFATGYYLLFGRQRELAIRAYLTKAVDNPRSLVAHAPSKEDWRRQIRQAAYTDLASDLINAAASEVVVVEGDEGSGKTEFLVGLTGQLAARGWIPVPIWMRHEREFRFTALARARFVEAIDADVDSDTAADAIWRRARSTRRVVVLVDDLDASPPLVDRDPTTGARLTQALRDLVDRNISVILTSAPGGLPLERALEARRVELAPLDEEQARSYLRSRLSTIEGPVERALEALRDPVEGIRAAPFFLDRIADLQLAGRLEPPGHRLPQRRDALRATLIHRYVKAIESGAIGAEKLADTGVDAEDRGRWRDAIRAAEDVANHLLTAAATSVELDLLASRREKFRCAVALGLLREAHGTVDFPHSAFQAYFMASAITEGRPVRLEQWVKSLQAPQHRVTPADRRALAALVIWCSVDPRRKDTALLVCEDLLATLERSTRPRPCLVTLVARIAAACGFTDIAQRIELCAIAALCADGAARNGRRAARTREELRLVTALAEMDETPAPQALFQAAQHRDFVVEWAAARALAQSGGAAFPAIRRDVERILDRAEAASDDELQRSDGELGYALGSLAWVLPALRDGSDEVERSFERTAALCLGPRVPAVRGEMSLADGLKLAVITRPRDALNMRSIERLLFERGNGLRFWYARLALTQAATIYGCHVREDTVRIRHALAQLLRTEPHALVKETLRLGIEALDGMRNGAGPSDLWAYLWETEQEVVTSARARKPEAKRLAADVVLLSNLIYRPLRRADAIDLGRHDEAVVRAALPPCIAASRDRTQITEGCDCGLALCGSHLDPPVVALDQARFDEQFCREQARLIREHGPPPWVARWPRVAVRRRRGLERFWLEMARIASREASGGGER